MRAGPEIWVQFPQVEKTVKEILDRETELVRACSGIKGTEIQEMLSSLILLGHRLQHVGCK